VEVISSREKESQIPHQWYKIEQGTKNFKPKRLRQALIKAEKKRFNKAKSVQNRGRIRQKTQETRKVGPGEAEGMVESKMLSCTNRAGVRSRTTHEGVNNLKISSFF
jgi:hypothetical protein